MPKTNDVLDFVDGENGSLTAQALHQPDDAPKKTQYSHERSYVADGLISDSSVGVRAHDIRSVIKVLRQKSYLSLK